MLPSHSLHWRTHYDNSQCHGMILFNFRFCVYLCYQVLLCKCKQVTGFVNVAVGLCPHVLFIICLSYSDICRTQRMRPKDQMLLRSCNWWPRCVPNVITCLLFWKFQRWDSGRPILRWCKSRFCKCVFPFSAKGILKLETEEKCKFTFLYASSPKAELKYKCQQRLPGLAPYFLFKAVFELPSKEWHQVPANMHILHVICICMAEVMCMCPRRAGIIPWPKSQCLSMPQSVVVLPLLLHGQIEMCFKILIQKGLHNAVNSPRTEISVIIYLQ